MWRVGVVILRHPPLRHLRHPPLRHPPLRHPLRPVRRGRTAWCASLYNGFVAEEVFAEAVEVDSAADGCGAVHGEDVVGMLLDALQAGPVALLAHGVVEAVGDGGIAGYAAVAILVEAVPISRLTVTSSKKRRRGCAASGSCGTAPGGVGLR